MIKNRPTPYMYVALESARDRGEALEAARRIKQLAGDELVPTRMQAKKGRLLVRQKGAPSSVLFVELNAAIVQGGLGARPLWVAAVPPPLSISPPTQCSPGEAARAQL